MNEKPVRENVEIDLDLGRYMLRDLWKNWPYWLKGGIIGVVYSLIYLFLIKFFDQRLDFLPDILKVILLGLGGRSDG